MFKRNPWKGLEKDLILFVLISAFIGFATGITDSIMNNYFSTFNMSPYLRGGLEFPRELPGLLVVLISGLLVSMGNIRMAVLANVIGAFGLLGLGFLSPTYLTMLGSLFLYSMGIHLWMPLNSSISMSLAKEGQIGRRLGQFSGITIAAGIVGSVLVWLGFAYWKFDFKISYVFTFIAFIIAAILLWKMNPGENKSGKKFQWVFRKRYFLFYALSVVFGARKQVFITFAPWVLIKVFNQPTQVFAILSIVGSLIGVLFIPLLGRSIDRFGERKILMVEAFLLIFVCIGYGFAKEWGLGQWALYITYACFIADRMLMAVGMARTTYLRKIAQSDADVTPTLSMGISMDHIVSMTIPALGGLVWELFGYQYVFVGAAVIALINLFMANHINVPIFSNSNKQVQIGQ